MIYVDDKRSLRNRLTISTNVDTENFVIQTPSRSWQQLISESPRMVVSGDYGRTRRLGNC